jgi:hypothetical protein
VKDLGSRCLAHSRDRLIDKISSLKDLESKRTATFGISLSGNNGLALRIAGIKKHVDVLITLVEHGVHACSCIQSRTCYRMPARFYTIIELLLANGGNANAFEGIALYFSRTGDHVRDAC